jgi:hypothetical protein
MYNLKTKKTSRIKLDDPRAMAANAGWNDALAGRPLNPYYSDNPSTVIAVTYMNWRLRATEIKRVMGSVPVWRTVRQVPRQVYAAFIKVKEHEDTLGNPSALPINRMPDDPDLKFR